MRSTSMSFQFLRHEMTITLKKLQAKTQSVAGAAARESGTRQNGGLAIIRLPFGNGQKRVSSPLHRGGALLLPSRRPYLYAQCQADG